MTKNINRNNGIILGVAPASKGFGYAVLEGDRTLVDWGVRTVAGDKNAGTLKQIAKMIAQYKPGLLVLDDASAKGSRRCLRIRTLTKKIIVVAEGLNIRVARFSRDEILDTFFIDGEGTKYSIAKLLAVLFPEELGPRLPPKRRAYESEDFRMSMFEAVALATAYRLRRDR